MRLMIRCLFAHTRYATWPVRRVYGATPDEANERILPMCRVYSCGCKAAEGLYCDVCKEFTPICPCCGCVYGEHARDCVVADGYDDSREGPWDKREEAENFARAEVGLPWGVERGTDGRFYVLLKPHDD